LERPDDEPPDVEWQSYCVFFLAPDGDAFHVLDETEAIEASAEAEEGAAPDAWPDTTSPGDEWTGCAVGISLATPYALINLDCDARYEDGTVRTPDVESFIYSDTTGERVDTVQHYRQILSPVAFQTLTNLSGRIASILRKHRILLARHATASRIEHCTTRGFATRVRSPRRSRRRNRVEDSSTVRSGWRWGSTILNWRRRSSSYSHWSA
jgi:hypothetical protein